MRQKSVHPESSSERIVKSIRRATRKRHSSEEKIRIVSVIECFETDGGVSYRSDRLI